MVIDGVSCAIIDGVDIAQPVFLPIEFLDDFQRIGSLQTYLSDERHSDAQEQVDAVIDACVERDLTPTVMARAIEILHAEKLSVDAAIEGALQWGAILRQLAIANAAC